MKLPADFHRSNAEVAFERQWQWLYPHLPKPETGFLFHPKRGWKVDFYFSAAQLAVEIEGWGHRTKARFLEDIAKYNALTELQIALLRFTPDQIETDPAGCCECVARMLEIRGSLEKTP